MRISSSPNAGEDNVSIVCVDTGEERNVPAFSIAACCAGYHTQIRNIQWESAVIQESFVVGDEVNQKSDRLPIQKKAVQDWPNLAKKQQQQQQ
ncbi:hypothetical protein EYF80_030681 [Liparis tanakae]|uniref:Uncharacterized protein n=1 Tax=Liparis tanakae TaxID=230148 RepID=A0A4Z2GZU3_9TELE|nr:hypothetical protein EYF80_030681 [Liparis tanakae]